MHPGTDTRSCAALRGLNALVALSLLLAAGCAQRIESTAPEPAPAVVAGTAASSPRTATEQEIIAQADSLLTRAPRPLKTISTAGRLPDDPVSMASQAARNDWPGMQALALAAGITGEARYGAALQSYFAAWIGVFEPSFNPISETQFHFVALAYELGGQYLSAETRAATLLLFRRMAEGYLNPANTGTGTGRNNWQSHRVKLVTALAFALEDADLMAGARLVFRKQVATNIAADGKVLDFSERDALHYVVYSLEPLLVAALIARQHGEDWYGYESRQGSSLTGALEWLAPYARGEKIHEEFKNTRNSFDRQRAAAGVPRFSGLWDASGALICYQAAARFDARWQPLASRLGVSPAWLALGLKS
ncbi:MAG: alginate lyase family protein [Pseudomonadota bacterium]